MSENLTQEQLDAIGSVVDVLNGAQRLLFITGAGMSADSGLPTYRGIGGLYNHEETIDGLSIEACLSKTIFDSRPELTWKYLGEIEKAAREASYNRGHEVMVELEGRFDVWILTQNVDGFHTLAGSQNVIEIHGTMRQLRCLGCASRQEVSSYEQLQIPPYCEQCGAMIRPEVVLFEEMLPAEAMQRYEQSLGQPFDVVFSVGTTSAFPYIAGPVYEASRAGVPTVEINPSETVVSPLVDHKLAMSAAICLDEIAKQLKL